MYNQARTLLLNLAGNNVPGLSYPGEEKIPPDYRPLPLPTWMQTLRSVIFTGSPDRAMLNYRAKELLLPLHSTDLVQYILDLDPRITYVPGWPLVDLLGQPVMAVQTAGPASTISFLGDLNNLRAHGRIWKQWRVTVVNGTDVSITYLDEGLGTDRTVIVSYTVSDGISSIVALPGSQISFRFTPGVGATWDMSALHRPVISLGEVELQLRIVLDGDPAIKQQLFGPATDEPFRTFKNLWEGHPFLHYRLGGIVLALIYQINALRG